MTDAPAQPKRRLPRFSLITLLVAVNVAGVLVWANWIETRDSMPSVTGTNVTYTIACGWPYTIGGWVEVADGRIVGRGVQHVGALIVNVLVATSTIFASAFLTEFIVRRFRKAKRHDG